MSEIAASCCFGVNGKLQFSNIFPASRFLTQALDVGGIVERPIGESHLRA